MKKTHIIVALLASCVASFGDDPFPGYWLKDNGDLYYFSATNTVTRYYMGKKQTGKYEWNATQVFLEDFWVDHQVISNKLVLVHEGTPLVTFIKPTPEEVKGILEYNVNFRKKLELHRKKKTINRVEAADVPPAHHP